MTARKRHLLLLIVYMLLPAMLPSQNVAILSPDYSRGISAWPNFTSVYQNPEVPEVDFRNSPRLEQLIRGGKLYLSLSDTIALAIENNLDIASARYGPKLADTDILRAKAGSQLRGVQTQISTLSTGQSARGGRGPSDGGDFSGITGRAGSGGNTSTGDASSFWGTTIPNQDLLLQGNIDWGHFSNPQISSFVAGTNTLVQERSNSGITLSKVFLTGGQVSLGWNNTRSLTNSINANFNPSLTSSFSLSIRQPLWQGFGRSLNSRILVTARNNRKVADLGFKQQIIETVASVQSLYWDLVSFIADVRGRKEDLRLSQKLYDDNKHRVKIGILAPIEIVRAEAEVAGRERDLTLAVTRVKQQEIIIKNALSRNGLASPSLMDVTILPTDHFEIPAVEQIQPLHDLMNLALQVRPEVVQSRIRLENRTISARGIRNAMMPQVDLVADVSNNGLAGQISSIYVPRGQTGAVPPFFLGGLGTSLGQVFHRNFPDYYIGVQVRIPLKNRRAQADMAADLLEKRRVEIQHRQTENSIRQQVANAVIGLQQSRSQYEAAQKSRILQEQTLGAEQKKFSLGASTVYNVVLAQRDLALARSQEISAQNNYVQAKVELNRATGQTLEANNISLDEAYSSNVSKPPDPIPPEPLTVSPQASGQRGIDQLLR